MFCLARLSRSRTGSAVDIHPDEARRHARDRHLRFQIGLCATQAQRTFEVSEPGFPYGEVRHIVHVHFTGRPGHSIVLEHVLGHPFIVTVDLGFHGGQRDLDGHLNIFANRAID